MQNIKLNLHRAKTTEERYYFLALHKDTIQKHVDRYNLQNTAKELNISYDLLSTFIKVIKPFSLIKTTKDNLLLPYSLKE